MGWSAIEEDLIMRKSRKLRNRYFLKPIDYLVTFFYIYLVFNTNLIFHFIALLRHQPFSI
jgi:hypothetical protein